MFTLIEAKLILAQVQSTYTSDVEGEYYWLDLMELMYAYINEYDVLTEESKAEYNYVISSYLSSPEIFTAFQVNSTLSN